MMQLHLNASQGNVIVHKSVTLKQHPKNVMVPLNQLKNLVNNLVFSYLSREDFSPFMMYYFLIDYLPKDHL